MRYAIARYQSQQRDLAYRIYVTDCLRINIQSFALSHGQSLEIERFADILNPDETKNTSAGYATSRIRNKLK